MLELLIIIGVALLVMSIAMPKIQQFIVFSREISNSNTLYTENMEQMRVLFKT